MVLSLRRIRSGILLLSSAASAACSGGSEDRPPPYACTTNCGSGAAGAGVGIGATGGAGGAETPSGDGGAPAQGESTSLTGNVLLFDSRFDAATSFTDTAVVEAQSPSGGIVTAFYDGATAFNLQRILAAKTNWIFAAPDSGNDAIATMQPIDTTRVNQANLTLVRDSALNQIFSLSTQSVFPSPEDGHALLLIRDAQDEPLPEVTVTPPSHAELLAYSVDDTWSDLAEETDARALVLVGNLDTTISGETFSFGLSGAIEGSIDARVRAGTVTVVPVTP